VDVDLSDGWNERGLTLFFEVQLRYFNFTFVRIFKEPTVGSILVDNSSDGYRVGGNGITDQDLASNANGPFEVDRIALSLTPYETRFAVNGSGGIISEKWDILDSGSQTLNLGGCRTFSAESAIMSYNGRSRACLRTCTLSCRIDSALLIARCRI
jgi:hypothetical protein